MVTETFRMLPDHLRWDVRIRKTTGPERTVRVIQFAPLPLESYQGWAPIADAPITIKPWLPFSIDYGQSTSGAVGEERWRTCIPMMVSTPSAASGPSPSRRPSRYRRCGIGFSQTLVLMPTSIGTRGNTPVGAALFPGEQRVPWDRENRPLETGLLISVHAADWRQALGWVYSKYRSYFDADPSVDRWDGVYSYGRQMLKDSLSLEDRKREYAARYERGIRKEELDGHYPWYGLMIPDAGVRTFGIPSLTRLP